MSKQVTKRDTRSFGERENNSTEENSNNATNTHNQSSLAAETSKNISTKKKAIPSIISKQTFLFF